MSDFYSTLTPKNKQNYNIKAGFLNPSNGYFITGKQGTGKTVLAIQTAKYWLEARKIDQEYESNEVKFIKFNEIVETSQKTFLTGEEGWFARRKMEGIKDYKLLIIDDLGTEKQTEFVKTLVYNLIDYRYEYLKQTIITSNYSLREISEKYHPRIASRLAEMCMTVTPSNKKDLRLKTT